jgi:transposase
MVATETDRGLFVGSLVASGYRVVAVNPLSRSRYRERHSTSGAKSDPGDAKVLAELARLDGHNHRLIAGDSDLADAVKVLARAHQAMIWSRQRHANQLRSTLREFLPAALVAFEDLASSDALAVLAAASTPARARSLSRSKIAAALRRGGRQRRVDARTIEIQTALRSDQLEAPPVLADAMGASAAALVAVITELVNQISRLEAELADRFEQHPDAKIIRSLPGLGMILGARALGEFGDDPNRYQDAKSRKNYASTSPITRASGKQRVVLAAGSATGTSRTPATHGHSQPSAPAPAPGPSMTNDAPTATPTTAPCEPSPTASSASSTAASVTARSTTNTPRGHTAQPSLLDIYAPGMSTHADDRALGSLERRLTFRVATCAHSAYALAATQAAVQGSRMAPSSPWNGVQASVTRAQTSSWTDRG